jgi:hypothetical protein
MQAHPHTQTHTHTHTHTYTHTHARSHTFLISTASNREMVLKRAAASRTVCECEQERAHVCELVCACSCAYAYPNNPVCFFVFHVCVLCVCATGAQELLPGPKARRGTISCTHHDQDAGELSACCTGKFFYAVKSEMNSLCAVLLFLHAPRSGIRMLESLVHDALVQFLRVVDDFRDNYNLFLVCCSVASPRETHIHINTRVNIP